MANGSSFQNLDNVVRVNLILCFNYIFQDPDVWEGAFRGALSEYEEMLYKAYKKGQFDNAELKPTWTWPNAMFFSGTIYTTIGEFKADLTQYDQN